MPSKNAITAAVALVVGMLSSMAAPTIAQQWPVEGIWVARFVG